MATEAESSRVKTTRDSESDFYASMTVEAGSSYASEERDSENLFSGSSIISIPPEDTLEEIVAPGIFVPKRKPLPIPYISPRVFRDQGPLSKEVWCPSLVDRIESEYSTATANFLYSIPRKRPALRDHSNCSSKRCTANDTDSGNYQCFHWIKECPDEGNCAFIGPDDQDVMNFVSDGVVQATFKSKFFAVSHVWSGGLGNPKANKLPTCQITRLHRLGVEIDSGILKKRTIAKLVSCIPRLGYLNKQGQESLLWIDTLCIPVNNWPLRWRAIDSMARIYATAQSIVIIDHELQQTPFKRLYRGSIFGRLFCSAWASRCWTFQEGAGLPISQLLYQSASQLRGFWP
jgi:hypothetical protein